MWFHSAHLRPLVTFGPFTSCGVFSTVYGLWCLSARLRLIVNLTSLRPVVLSDPLWLVGILVRLCLVLLLAHLWPMVLTTILITHVSFGPLTARGPFDPLTTLLAH